MEKLRWGIVGTADIARQNWRAIFNSGNSIVTAVASRSIERSKQFIKTCQAENKFEVQPKAYSNYEQLIDAPDIDAVYIPLPTGLRKEWVLRTAKAGKHVLCEKPCGINLNDVQEMVETCQQNKVQFMDGVMFMHNPRLQRIRKVLDDSQSIGQIKRISSMFSFRAPEDYLRTNIRLHSELEPTGCLGDLGWYNIRFSLWAMKWHVPYAVTGRILSQRGGKTSPAPTPTDFSGELIFSNDTSADFYCSFLTAFQQWSTISGTKGSLSIPDFVHPVNIHEPSFDVNNIEARVKCCNCTSEHTESRIHAQDTLMIRNFVNQICSGQLNKEWPLMAVTTQRVLDACFKSAKNDSKLTLL
ncbi:MAG: Gfo/Idh/MocA family oxidoreductase [Ignavibacteriales bacterium]|nr:Gfo/Idh/MocA family oxidoreductase [Ignavibacteriales bacterium]